MTEPLTFDLGLHNGELSFEYTTWSAAHCGPVSSLHGSDDHLQVLRVFVLAVREVRESAAAPGGRGESAEREGGMRGIPWETHGDSACLFFCPSEQRAVAPPGTFTVNILGREDTLMPRRDEVQRRPARNTSRSGGRETPGCEPGFHQLVERRRFIIWGLAEVPSATEKNKLKLCVLQRK